MQVLISRLIGLLQTSDDAGIAKKLRRRKALEGLLYRNLSKIRILLFIIGYAWMLLLPSSQLGRGIYIDENALQPGQVNTYWSWSDVHSADVYLGQVEQLCDNGASNLEKAQFLQREFLRLGIPAATQNYTFNTGSATISGVNAYAVLAAPRTSGTEAIVIAASWKSLNGGPNLRGISTVLSLAAYLKKYSLWAKDIVFVISDGYMDGMQAWLGAYHGIDQSNLVAKPLTLHSGVIWTALAIDYPGHSFSHLGVFYEGLNGRLPNQDLMNSFNIISTHTGGVPVILYDHLDDQMSSLLPRWFPQFLRDQPLVQDYAKSARNILRHVKYQALGSSSGIHGLFHRFRVDAITLYAVPADGPHGFHAIGRIVESTLRTMNNLLERLHASFFFYILKGPGTFLKIGEYLPSVVIISVAMMFGGLQLWVDAGWVQRENSPTEDKTTQKPDSREKRPKWVTRRREVLLPIAIMVGTHVGGILFWMATNPWLLSKIGPGTSYLPVVPFSIMVGSISVSLLSTEEHNHVSLDKAPLHLLLKSFNLCLASTVISITSVLNFSLAAILAIILGIPLSLSSPTKNRHLRKFKAVLYYTLLVPVYSILFVRPMSRPVWEWQVFGVWFAPFMCLVYFPLVLQTIVVCQLNP